MISRVVILLMLMGTVATARDQGQWNGDPGIKEWFESLKQPDYPAASCCGEADAYWCDEIHVKDFDGVKKTFCKITDDRDDDALKRMSVPIGTEIEIPDYKLTWKDGNPTGHSIVFLSRGMYVYCFVQSGGT